MLNDCCIELALAAKGGEIMSGYTEGPWSFEPKCGSIIISSENNSAIAKIEPLLCWDIPRANARLIAAAPDNYECNVELAKIVRELCASYGHPLPQAALDRSDSAIAKATEV